MPSDHSGLRARAFLSNEKSGDQMGEGETSFRVYYGANGAAVPFIWESQPGTPKHPIFDRNDPITPPLTPPPSYTTTTPTSSSSHNNNNNNINNKCRKSRIFDIILSSFTRKNSRDTPVGTGSSPSSTLSSWSTTSSSSSSISSPRKSRSGGGRNSHRRSISFCSFRAKSPLFCDEHHDEDEEDEDDDNDDDDDDEMGSQHSRICLGFKKKYKGCYSMQDNNNNMKKCNFVN